MAIKKNLSSADIEVLGQAEIRRRKATQGSCKSCFLLSKLNDEGICPTCEGDRKKIQPSEKPKVKSYWGQIKERYIPEYDPRRYVQDKTNYHGSQHSPAYLGSCAKSGLPNNDGVPHPDALGVLPTDATLDDYDHYAKARGGYIEPSHEGVKMFIDLRTKEQRDPSHRNYLPTPMLVSHVIPHKNHYQLTETGKGAPVDMNVHVVRDVTNGPPKPKGINATDDIIRSVTADLTPKEYKTHLENHGWKNNEQTVADVDEAGVPWKSTPETCSLCYHLELTHRAAYDHIQGEHADKVDPLCPRC